VKLTKLKVSKIMALNIAKSPLVGPVLALNGWTFVMEVSIDMITML
jgi:hypothetical protein